MSKSSIPLVFSLAVILSLACIRTFVHAQSEEIPWGVGRIRAQCVWDNNGDKVLDGGANAGDYISIAVIDSGVDYYIDNSGKKVFHPDLADNIEGGAYFRYLGSHYVEVVEDNQYDDDWGHGTEVAGIIAASANGDGIIGAAPKAKIYALKLASNNEEGCEWEAATAINWSVQHGIQIISMSIGFNTDYNDTLLKACEYAYANRVLLVAAAGNDNKDYIVYPARYNEYVIAVGAINESDERWVEPPDYGSHYGLELELMAPGVNIISTGLDWAYDVNLTGTSYAVPHVAAAAALVFNSKIDPDYCYGDCWVSFEVREKLKNTTLDLGEPDFDIYYGYGLVNAWYANQRPPGDINNDNYVNARDAVILGRAFGSHPGSPNWNQTADINIDNFVNTKDAVILGKHFNEHWDP